MLSLKDRRKRQDREITQKALPLAAMVLANPYMKFTIEAVTIEEAKLLFAKIDNLVTAARKG